jgi:hypothetical protein
MSVKVEAEVSKLTSRMAVLLDGDCTTWSDGAAVLLMTDELAERMADNPKQLPKLIYNKLSDVSKGDYMVCEAHALMEAILCIHEIVNRARNLNANAKAEAFDEIDRVVTWEE